jgi:hypothetical protein
MACSVDVNTVMRGQRLADAALVGAGLHYKVVFCCLQAFVNHKRAHLLNARAGLEAGQDYALALENTTMWNVCARGQSPRSEMRSCSSCVVCGTDRCTSPAFLFCHLFCCGLWL